MHRRTLLAALPTLPALSACTPSLSLFDSLTPKDPGVQQLAAGASYGPLPRHTVDVYAPKTAETGAHPVLMFIHGGSWRSGDRTEYNFVGRALAAQGFVVAIPNYRLVPEVRFPAFIEDCALALRWAQQNISRYRGNPDKIALMGHSAGAYNAMMVALDPRYGSAAGVVRDGVKGAIGLAGPYDFLPFDVDSTRDAFGSAAEPVETQPLNFARADAPPLLLLWGEADETVGRRNLVGLERAIVAAGGSVETKIYPGVDHAEILLALSRPFRSVAPVLSDVTAFARRVTA
ncbi:MAG: alpha/beta hydrolase [Hyphomonadaceae bacterium]|nr:alpha/beta hydrolase [Hyphomonadaceae bacterium]